ncbi:hypothetical protein [Bacillus wiedmannii]
MREEQAIKKEKIDNYLQEYLDIYISSLINELKEYKYDLSKETIKKIQDLLVEIRGYSKDEIIVNLIVEELMAREYKFENLISDLDLSPNVKEYQLVKRVIQLIVSQELIKIQLILTLGSNVHNVYDVFLSHCSWDAREILGIKLLLEYKYKVSTYVDWIDDKKANFPRSIKKVIGVIKELGKGVLPLKLEKIQEEISIELENQGLKGDGSEKQISRLIIERLEGAKSIFYVQSRHYDYSRWMPWELGIAEASGKKIYRLPIKYIRTRKKYGKRSGFLIRYESIIGKKGYLKEKELKTILK